VFSRNRMPIGRTATRPQTCYMARESTSVQALLWLGWRCVWRWRKYSGARPGSTRSRTGRPPAPCTLAVVSLPCLCESDRRRQQAHDGVRSNRGYDSDSAYRSRIDRRQGQRCVCGFFVDETTVFACCVRIEGYRPGNCRNQHL